MSHCQSRSILFLGPFPDSQKRSVQVSEEIAGRLPTDWTAELCSTRSTRIARFFDQLRAATVDRRAVSVVNLYGGRSFWPAALQTKILARRGKATVIHLHGGSLPELAQRHPSTLRRTLGRASIVVAPSAFLQRTLAAHRSDIVVIDNGIDLADYRVPKPRSNTPRTTTILWLRSFHETYNPKMAVRAFAMVAAEHPEARLQMIGTVLDASEFAATRKLVYDLGLEPKVDLGQGIAKSRVAQVMREADLFVNTTNVDNTPVTVIEAMASGLPIVSTSVGGIPDLLRHGTTALLTEKGSDAQTAAALKTLLRDPQLAERLATSARAEAARFCWSMIMPRWMGLFEGLADTAARTSFEGAMA